MAKQKRSNTDVLGSEIEMLSVEEAMALIELFSSKIMNEPVDKAVCALASSLVRTQLLMKIMTPESVRAAIELAELILADRRHVRLGLARPLLDETGFSSTPS